MTQPPRENPSEARNPLVVAMEWVSRITTVALEMVVPAVIGGWLDQRWGTKYLALVGVILGVTTGLWHLVWMAKKATPPKRPKDPTQSL